MVTFVEYFNIDPEKFESLEAFNPQLNQDSQLYIDPKLIKTCKVKEFQNSAKQIETYFNNVLRLVRLSKREGDIAWECAEKLLVFKEISGTCIGYSNTGTRGNSIGSTFSKTILKLAKEIIDLGMEDPLIFEVATMFQKGIGCDRISDIITNIVYKSILQYSMRVVMNLNIKTNTTVVEDGITYDLVLNPFDSKPILFLPHSVLSKLPISESCSDIDTVCSINSINRSELSKYVNFKDRSRSIPKEDLAFSFLHDKKFRELIIRTYNESNTLCVDSNLFEPRFKKIIGNIDSFYEPVNSLEDLIKLVKSINEIFKDFVENKGINKTFHFRGKPLEEYHVQSAYFIVAELKCRDVDVDLSRESNNGRGPVDFKMSKGHEAKVVVEVKLTSNSRIKNGLRKQLPEYMKAENAKHGFYLVVDLNNSGFTKIEKEFSIFEDECDNIELCLVDGNIKPSASKL